jgi:hypothetical protein
MGIVFDYADKLNKQGVNPRETSEITSLIIQTGKLRPDLDESRGLIFKHAWPSGRFGRQVHVLCPIAVASAATRMHPTKNFFWEWLFVAVKGDLYIIDVETERDKRTQTSTSQIAQVSKNPSCIEWKKSFKGPAKQFVAWWLKQCKLEATESARPMPITRPSGNGARVQRFPNTSGATVARLSGGQDSLSNADSEHSLYN